MLTTPSLPISSLPFFNQLVRDYATQSPVLDSLISFKPTLDGILKASDSKRNSYNQRALLASIIEVNYPKNQSISDIELAQLEKLKGDALAITTAHQPNLFLGPCYIFTKALSIIALSNKLNASQTKYHYVPIFVIGSEDHDKEELLQVTLFGEKFVWKTPQEGPVGRMIIDDSLVVLRDQFLAKLGNNEMDQKLKSIYIKCYQIGVTLAQAYANILRELFASYGLIVLDIATDEVKKSMSPIFEKELTDAQSSKNIESTLAFLKKNYLVQAEGRTINLFEYQNGLRVRIEHTDLETLQRLRAEPEKFSPNVILRPLMQQMVLPSVANIGGGAEVSYWLQLKANFDYYNIDFPVILLRDIYTILDQKSYNKWAAWSLSIPDFFEPIDKLKKNYIWQHSQFSDIFDSSKTKIELIMQDIKAAIGQLDKSLEGSTEAEQIKIVKSIELLEAKVMKSEKKKQEDILAGIETIQSKVIENNILKERIENFTSYYSRYGDELIVRMLDKANPFNFDWKCLVMG